MKRLQIKRKAARRRRAVRRELLHAAGCVLVDCCVRQYARESPLMVAEAIERGIRVPRSLRRMWGRDG